jgi:hypothetical protein
VINVCSENVFYSEKKSKNTTQTQLSCVHLNLSSKLALRSRLWTHYTDYGSGVQILRFYTSGAFTLDSSTPILRINLNERTIEEEICENKVLVDNILVFWILLIIRIFVQNCSKNSLRSFLLWRKLLLPSVRIQPSNLAKQLRYVSPSKRIFSFWYNAVILTRVQKIIIINWNIAKHSNKSLKI